MKLKLAVLMCALCSLVSCAAPAAPQPQESYGETRWVNVYYASAEAGRRDEVIAAESCEIPKGNLEQTVREIYLQSCREPISNSLKSPIPQDTTLESVEMKDGTVVLGLSREYGNINGFSRTVADYCLTMSMCELEGIRDVTILIDGTVSGTPNSERLNSDDIVISDLDLVGFRKKLKLYFPSRDNTTLELELRDTVSNGTEDEALLVMKALIDGPTKRGLNSVMPYETKVNSVQMVKNVCVVDLSSEFISNRIPTEERERMCIRAIVDSLSEIQGIEQVQIVIEGAKTPGFTYFDLSRPFSQGYI